ncbi:hypothetical protein [Candidatus Phytoplasma solani]|uniref:hypothetical protein n=1 Tax=Candidatus Phytoplasma solani TaxID=69896 RepID=UPI00358EBD21
MTIKREVKTTRLNIYGKDDKRPKTGFPNTVNISKEGIVDYFDANGKRFQSTCLIMPYRIYIVAKFCVNTGIVDTVTHYSPNSSKDAHYTVFRGKSITDYNYDGTIKSNYKLEPNRKHPILI